MITKQQLTKKKDNQAILRFPLFAYLPVLFIMAASLEAHAGTPIRIWPLGDSITLGKSTYDEPYPTYRKRLHERLTAAGWDIDFVGTQTGFCTTTGWTTETCLAEYPDWQDQQHDGWSGWATQWVWDDVVKPNVASVAPDIVLLHLGTNDAYKGYTQAQSHVALRGIIDEVRAVNPQVEFYVAAIIPAADSNEWHDPIEELSAWIRDYIEVYSTPASPVHMVDMYSGYNNVDWYVPESTMGGGPDGIHPEHFGEEFMADQWFDAMVPEPATMIILLGGGGLMCVIRRRV